MITLRKAIKLSRKFDKEGKILDKLQQENKELKQTNRRLQKQVKELSRGYYKFLYTETEEETQKAVNQAKNVAKKICFDCNVGELQLTIIGSRYWRYCNNCSKRTKSQNIDNLTPEEIKKYNESIK